MRRQAFFCFAAVALASCQARYERPTVLARDSPASGVSRRSSTEAPVNFQVRLAHKTPASGLTPIQLPHNGETVFMEAQPELTNADVVSAEAILIAGKEPAVTIRFTPQGAEQLKQVTASNRGKRLIFLADNKVLYAPVIFMAIDTPAATIAGNLTPDSAQALAAALSPQVRK